MAPGFFSSVSKSFHEWRRRAQEAAKKIAPKEFVLEFLEERLNPANFNIDLANYNGAVQVTSFGPANGGLKVTTAGTDLLEYRVEHMNWEEFVICELNPVLEKISRHGLRSLSAEERRILRYSRRKLEGW